MVGKRIKFGLVQMMGCALVIASAYAQAQTARDPGRAQKLFDAALKLISTGEYQTACPLLEDSERLDPGMGTRFRLAECYEKTDRPAKAWYLFNSVAAEAKIAGQEDRERVAKQRAEALEPRLAKVVLKVPDNVGTLMGLEIKQDGVVVDREQWGQPVPVDLGEHSIEVTAEGKQPWNEKVKVEQLAQRVEIEIPQLTDSKPKTTPPPPKPVETGPIISLSGQQIIALAAAGVGTVGIVVGSIFGANAASQWSDAKSKCEGGNVDKCPSSAISLGQDASGSATVSTIGFLIGIAGLGAGAYLWFTAPPKQPTPQKTGLQVIPIVGPKAAFGVVHTTF